MKSYICCFAAFISAFFLPAILNAEEKNALAVNFWGRGVFAPLVENNRGEKSPAQGTSWGGDGSRIGWSIKGVSANAGFHVDMNCDGGKVGFHDQQKIWIKPVPFFTVEVGPSVFYEKLRGDAAFGVWNWMRFGNQDDEDAIFVRGKAGGGDQNQLHQNANGIQGGWKRDNGIYAGCIIHLDANGFYMFAALDQSNGSIVASDDPATSDVNEEVRAKYSTADMFRRGQYGVGYRIISFGLIRAQYIGKAYLKNFGDEKLTNYGVINTALKIDSLFNNLYLDLGLFYPTKKQKRTGDSEGYAGYSGYVKYDLDFITLHATCQTKLDKKDKKGKEGTAFHSGIGIDVAVDSFLISTDFRYMNNNWNANSEVNNTLGFLIGVSRCFSNGKIGLGFEYCTTTIATNFCKEKPGDAMWAIPVIVEVWF